MTDKSIDLDGYFDTGTLLNLRVFTIDGPAEGTYIFDIKPYISISDGWLSVEICGILSPAFYFDYDKVIYFSIIPLRPTESNHDF